MPRRCLSSPLSTYSIYKARALDAMIIANEQLGGFSCHVPLVVSHGEDLHEDVGVRLALAFVMVLHMGGKWKKFRICGKWQVFSV